MVLSRIVEAWIIIIFLFYAILEDWLFLLGVPLILFIEIIIGIWDKLDSGIWFNSIKEDRERLMKYFNIDYVKKGDEVK